MTPEQIEKEFIDTIVGLCEKLTSETYPPTFMYRVLSAHAKMKYMKEVHREKEFNKRFPKFKKEAEK